MPSEKALGGIVIFESDQPRAPDVGAICPKHR